MSKNYITDKNSFIVYKDWEDYLKRFSDEDAGRIFKALFAFACRGEDTKLDGALDMLFDVMKHTIERDGKKWEEVCAARSHYKKQKMQKLLIMIMKMKMIMLLLMRMIMSLPQAGGVADVPSAKKKE